MRESRRPLYPWDWIFGSDGFHHHTFIGLLDDLSPGSGHRQAVAREDIFDVSSEQRPQSEQVVLQASSAVGVRRTDGVG